MVNVVTPATHLEVYVHVKIFLSMLHKFDNSMQAGVAEASFKPCWVEKFIFVCLLNVPDVQPTTCFMGR